MQVKTSFKNDTNAVLSIITAPEDLQPIHEVILKEFQKTTKLPGFREGKAPLNIISKNIDQSRLQTSFLDRAVGEIYRQAVSQEKLRPIGQPTVSIKKFVPFSVLEAEFEVEVIGKMELVDYKKMSLPKKKISVTTKDIDEVLKSLVDRSAEASEVKRAAKKDDQVVIDFVGTDTKSGALISGAEGKAYPIVIGSDTFIPGFEPKLIGLKAGDEKTFDITFPKDYSQKSLQSKKVTFKVNINQVNELKKGELNDELAAKVGPFKSLTELKDDVSKQLMVEKEQKQDQIYENEVINYITEKSSVKIPEALVDEQIERSELEEKQNITYRGQTWQEHLDEEGVTEEEHRSRNRKTAESIVKSSLLLSEIADIEKINVTPEEVEIRVQLLKGQYQDPQMHAELEKPENLGGIRNQLLTEKTFKLLSDIASK